MQVDPNDCSDAELIRREEQTRPRSGPDEEMRRTDVLHPVSKDEVETTDFGTREFATLDLDGNLVTFFQWTSPD